MAEKSFDGRMIHYAWSQAGRITQVIHADGSHRTVAYDRAGRIAAEQNSDHSAVSYQRDRMGRLLGAVIEENGRRKATLFERDAVGRVVVERQGDRVIRYTYDARGRRASRVMPDGSTTRYQHDASDTLTAVEHDGHQLAFERDAIGREVLRQSGDAVSVKSVYDAMDRLVEQRATVPAPGDGVPAVLSRRQWKYDRTGKVMCIDDARWGATEYAYDAVGQLLEAKQGGRREAFAYDLAGSLVQALEGLDVGPAGASWETAPGNLLKQSGYARYAYDARGRRTGKLVNAGGEERYGWDAWGMSRPSCL